MPQTEQIEVAGGWEAYAAMWGCDPCYDRAPRLPGDGYLFYNFGVEGRDPEFLKKFLPAIDRTLEEVKGRGVLDEEDTADIENLEALKEEVLRRLE